MMTNKYKIQFDKKYLKDLKTIPKKFHRTISKRIQELSTESRPRDSKKLKNVGKFPLYRIRNGDYRIVYTVKDAILLVILIQISHRKDIYREL